MVDYPEGMETEKECPTCHNLMIRHITVISEFSNIQESQKDYGSEWWCGCGRREETEVFKAPTVNRREEMGKRLRKQWEKLNEE